MKKIVTLFFVIVLVVSIVFITNKSKNTSNNNKISNNDLPKSIDELITYKVLDDYEIIEEIHYHDSEKDKNENIIVERSYEKQNNSGRFTVSIFSYKRKEVVDSNNEIDEDEYISYLVNTNKITIDNHEFTIGYSGSEEFDDVIGRAYTKDGDYVFLFSMSNYDSHLTDKQYNDFINMIKTIKFK